MAIIGAFLHKVREVDYKMTWCHTSAGFHDMTGNVLNKFYNCTLKSIQSFQLTRKIPFCSDAFRPRVRPSSGNI